MIAKLITDNNGSLDDAKDVFQEAVIILYDKVKSDDFELKSLLKTYLYAICRNIWLKRLQYGSILSYDIELYSDQLAVEEDIEEKELKDEAFKKMEGALQQLGEPCRTIIRDFYIRNLSMTAICDKFGYTNPDNAKNQKYKCLQRLKKLFFRDL